MASRVIIRKVWQHNLDEEVYAILRLSLQQTRASLVVSLLLKYLLHTS